MRADALPPLDDHDDRLYPGRQREHRRVRSRARDRAAGAARRRVGARRRRVRPVGRGLTARERHLARRGRAMPTRGHRRAQVAQRAVRQRHRVRARAAALRGCDGESAPPTCARGARRDPYDYTPEMSRRARGVEVWAALRSLGRDGLADSSSAAAATRSASPTGCARAGYEILNDVVLNRCWCRSATRRPRVR